MKRKTKPTERMPTLGDSHLLTGPADHSQPDRF